MVCMWGGAIERGRFGRQRLQSGGLRLGKASKPSSGGVGSWRWGGWAHATGIAALHLLRKLSRKFSRFGDSLRLVFFCSKPLHKVVVLEKRVNKTNFLGGRVFCSSEIE